MPEGEREGLRPLPTQVCRDCGAVVTSWYLNGSPRQPVCRECYLYLRVEFDALDLGQGQKCRLVRALIESLLKEETG